MRPSALTSEKLGALREALAEHPGEDDVIVCVRAKRIRLGVRVDSTSRPSVRAIALAVSPECVRPVDLDEATW